MTSPSDLTPHELHTIAKRVCTPKELQVIHALSKGLGRRRTAITLQISESAVRARRDNALRKIQATLNQEAA